MSNSSAADRRLLPGLALLASKLLATEPVRAVVARFNASGGSDSLIRKLHRSARAAIYGQMKVEDVLRVREAFRQVGLPFKLLGGWGIDALYGSQTRVHDDLDLVIEDFEQNEPVARAVLHELGYRRLYAIDLSSDLDYLMPKFSRFEDDAGHRIELVNVFWDRVANMKVLRDENLFGMDPDRLASVAFTTGVVGEKFVLCLTAAVQRAFHTVGPGFPDASWMPNHRRDLALLNDQSAWSRTESGSQMQHRFRDILRGNRQIAR